MAKATKKLPHVNEDHEKEPEPEPEQEPEPVPEHEQEEEEEEDQTFEELGLDPRLIRALTKKSIDNPTPIQRVAIPLILVSFVPPLLSFGCCYEPSRVVLRSSLFFKFLVSPSSNKVKTQRAQPVDAWLELELAHDL